MSSHSDDLMQSGASSDLLAFQIGHSDDGVSDLMEADLMEADIGSHIDDNHLSAGIAGPFHWAYDVVQALLDRATVPMLRSSLFMTGQSVATNFSGVGTVEQAVKFINAATSHHLGQTTSLRFVSACESDGANQALLRRCFEDDSESSTPCLFPNILGASAIGGDLAKLVQSKTSVDFSQAWKCVRAGGLTERGRRA
jgi:hypothetical protein